jgi:DNA-binding NarL/FixJ family response regulator
MNKVKVVIADSSELIRIGLTSIFERTETISIVGKCASMEELRHTLNEEKADVVIIDYTSKEFDISVVPEVLEVNKRVRFIGITKDQMAQTIVDALKFGVASHVKKDCSAKEITESVLETAAGNKFFCGQVLDLINEDGINVDNVEFEPLSCEPISLSTREIEVMILIAEGSTNAQIAEKLFLSSHTVGTHRKNIMRKLGVNNTAGIVMYAVKSQLVSPNKFLFASSNL